MKVLQHGRGAFGAGPEAAARRSTELGLVVLAVILAAGGYVLTALAEGHRASRPTSPPSPPAPRRWPSWPTLAVRRFAPRADGTLLGLAILLNGIGFVTIARLDPDLARYQSLWTAVGVAAFVDHPAGGPADPRPGALPLHLRPGRDRLAAAPGRPRHRPGDQRGPAVGADRAAQLPARGGGQGHAGDLPGRLPGGEAGAAVDPHLAGRAR